WESIGEWGKNRPDNSGRGEALARKSCTRTHEVYANSSPAFARLHSIIGGEAFVLIVLVLPLDFLWVYSIIGGRSICIDSFGFTIRFFVQMLRPYG
ncbi:MAG: hypothetical protein WBG66_22365, partial [Geitlerinemataceae cyanobacterium]